MFTGNSAAGLLANSFEMSASASSEIFTSLPGVTYLGEQETVLTISKSRIAFLICMVDKIWFYQFTEVCRKAVLIENNWQTFRKRDDFICVLRQCVFSLFLIRTIAKPGVNRADSSFSESGH
jgi:hypothetical protein